MGKWAKTGRDLDALLELQDCDSVASTSLQPPTQSVEPPLKVFSQPPTAELPFKATKF